MNRDLEVIRSGLRIAMEVIDKWQERDQLGRSTLSDVQYEDGIAEIMGYRLRCMSQSITRDAVVTLTVQCFAWLEMDARKGSEEIA